MKIRNQIKAIGSEKYNLQVVCAISQKQFAERMNCSQQYVSKILKGCENLSLETMAKIECALGITVMQCELAD